MSLIDDFKTFLMALAIGVAITVSVNYVVVNYTSGPAPVQAAAHNDSYDHDEANEYKAPSPVQKTDTGASYGAYY
jgi:hypothetical protein